jgi:NAD(P)-dependent dehydrogenase (short-subunit alcohol dehydrogenase family)
LIKQACKEDNIMATVLITGTNKGVGLELTKIYAARGDTVLAACRDPNAAEALNRVAGSVEVVGVTVGDNNSVAALASSLEGRAIDVLINNAGTSGPARDQQTTFAMDFEGWADAFNINTMAPVRMMQALMPNLRLSGAAKVMTVTSQMGALSLDMAAAHAYCATKAAVNKFMRLAALDLKKEGIAVGLVHPGWVKTDMGGPHADITPEESAAGCAAVTDGLSIENTGGFWKWNGEVHGW